MPGTARSGQRKTRTEERKSIGKIYPYAISTIASIMKDTKAPVNARLEASKYLCDQYLGKAVQSHDIEDELMETTRELLDKWQEARRGKDEQREAEALQGEENVTPG